MNVVMGVDERKLRETMKELAIRENRQDEVLNFLKEVIESGNTEVDNLQRFIAFSTKANELCFLSFMQGVFVGGCSMSEQITKKLPDIIEHSARYGAAQALKGNLPPDMEEAPGSTDKTPTEPKKKEQQSDIMYG